VKNKPDSAPSEPGVTDNGAAADGDPIHACVSWSVVAPGDELLKVDRFSFGFNGDAAVVLVPGETRYGEPLRFAPGGLAKIDALDDAFDVNDPALAVAHRRVRSLRSNCPFVR
jgi:hypothetical protein